MGTVGELLCHNRIHGDHHVSLLCHSFVAIFDLGAHPLLERLANHCGADVDDPLLGHFLQVWLIGEVEIDLRLVADELHDLFDGEVLVLRHMHGLDVSIVEIFLSAR